MAKKSEFALEADLVTAFCAVIHQRNDNARREKRNRRGHEPSTWTIYHETGGYDLVLVEDQTGVQVGIEAKLSLNLKVINQILPNRYDRAGPDYRAVLVPKGGIQPGLSAICDQIGIVVIGIYDSVFRDQYTRGNPPAQWHITCNLPDERATYDYATRDWHAWLPIERIKLPEYVPDVSGGKPSPVALTDWKIRAIKLLIILERRGHVTRKDMQALAISPTRWTAGSYGYLVSDRTIPGYVACSNTPDLRAQHPTNYAQIEADAEKWLTALEIKVD